VLSIGTPAVQYNTNLYGWLLALSIIETQGLFLAWAVHFVQDVVIFASMFAIKGTSVG